MLRDAVEEARPSLPGTVVLLGRHPSALLEDHLRPERWRAYLGGDELEEPAELAFYCPECTERCVLKV